MIVVLEGPDGAGKTTLAHKLLDKWEGLGGTKYVHHVANESLPVRVEREVADEFIYGSGMLTVFDRWWPSDYIYPQIEGRPRSLKTHPEYSDAWRDIGLRISERGVFVLVTEDPETLVSRRENSTFRESETILDKYEELFTPEWARFHQGEFTAPESDPVGSTRDRHDAIDYVINVVASRYKAAK